jgi:secreted trypsin-like serine protease
MNRHTEIWIAVAVLAIGPLACGGPTPDELEGSGHELVGGTKTYARPEVGYYYSEGGGICTATLVKSTVAITAAHCVGFRTTSGAPNYGAVNIQTKTSTGAIMTRTYYVKAMKSYGSTTGINDIALLQLSNSVPSTVASPASLASVLPATGASATRWGYGCTDRTSKTGIGTKRYEAFQMGTNTSMNCPGDSGGPSFDTSGRLFWITSSYFNATGYDNQASVPRHYDAIKTQIADW